MAVRRAAVAALSEAAVTFAGRDVSSVGGDSRDCKEMCPRVQQVLASDHL